MHKVITESTRRYMKMDLLDILQIMTINLKHGIHEHGHLQICICNDPKDTLVTSYYVLTWSYAQALHLETDSGNDAMHIHRKLNTKWGKENKIQFLR